MVFPLDEGLARRLLQAMFASPRVKMRRKHFAMGYVSTSFAQCDYLNSSNQYRQLTPASRALLDEFLATAGPMVEPPLAIASASPRRGSSSSFPTGPRPTATSTAGPSPCARSSCCLRAAASDRARPGSAAATARNSRWRARSRSGCCSRTASCCMRPFRAWRCVRPSSSTSCRRGRPASRSSMPGWVAGIRTFRPRPSCMRNAPGLAVLPGRGARRRAGRELAQAHRPVARAPAAQGRMISDRACRGGSAARCRCRAGSPPPGPPPWPRSR